MALQEKTQKQAPKATAKTVAPKGNAGAQSVKKPSTRDTLKKATLAKKSSSAPNSPQKTVSRREPGGKSSAVNKTAVLKAKTPVRKAGAEKTGTLPKTAAVKQPAAQKTAAKKSAVAKKDLVKSTAGKKTGKGKKSTTELLKAIKARDTETQENNAPGPFQADPAGNPISEKMKTSAKRRLPLTIVPPMQKAVEIIAPSSSSKKKVRKFSFSQKDLASFRSELLVMRDHFAGQTKSMKHDALQRDDEVNPEEDGTDAFMRLQALNQMDDQQHIVADIDMALNAIEKGTYGTCEMCDCLISKLRLKARPFAKFCVKCKSEMERLNRFNKPR